MTDPAKNTITYFTVFDLETFGKKEKGGHCCCILYLVAGFWGHLVHWYITVCRSAATLYLSIMASTEEWRKHQPRVSGVEAAVAASKVKTKIEGEVFTRVVIDVIWVSNTGGIVLLFVQLHPSLANGIENELCCNLHT